jgi:23S rRNA (guanosine2251-2'-O)-methyltransferase
VGGEGEGLRALVHRSCDFRVSIPMAPGVESLNVAVATGIALYETLIRRAEA